MTEKIKLLIISPNSRANQTKKINKGFINSEMCESIKILAFDRDEGKAENIDYLSLGNIYRSKYISRLFNICKAVFIASKECAKCDAVFTWTLDCLIITLLAKLFSGNWGLKVLYNVRDVHPLLTKKTTVAFSLRVLDKFLSRFVHLFVFTSPCYYDGYYCNMIGLNNIKWVVVENKVPEELWQNVSRPAPQKTSSDDIKIGYFGLMAYRNSWEIIKSILKSDKNNIKFYLRGYNYIGDYFEKDLQELNNVVYEGPYKNPEDLQAMFEKIDVSWAINAENYTPNTNDQWAMCNRFYEGLYFKKPLIVQEGSAHSDFVKNYDIGVCVDARDVQKTKDIVLNITQDDVRRWQENIEKIDDSVFVMGESEYKKIIDAI